MRDPLWRLKTLPWLELLQTAALAVALATVLEWGLIQLIIQSNLAVPPLALLALPFAAMVGTGALGLKLLERCFPRLLLDTATLWGLVPCVALLVWLKTLVLPANVFLTLTYPQLVGIALGVFLTGRRHCGY